MTSKETAAGVVAGEEKTPAGPTGVVVAEAVTCGWGVTLPYPGEKVAMVVETRKKSQTVGAETSDRLMVAMATTEEVMMVVGTMVVGRKVAATKIHHRMVVVALAGIVMNQVEMVLGNSHRNLKPLGFNFSPTKISVIVKDPEKPGPLPQILILVSNLQ